MGVDLNVSGREHIKKEYTYIIMGNHQSLFDLLVIPSTIPFHFVGVEASYHFKLPVWGWLIRKWGCIPIKRHDKASAIKSIETAESILKSGTSIGILPEGHRTLTGNVGEFKKGPFHLVKNTKADILPFGIKGLFEYNRKGSFILKPGKVCVKIGKPVAYESYQDLSVSDLREKIRAEIIRLSK